MTLESKQKKPVQHFNDTNSCLLPILFINIQSPLLDSTPFLILLALSYGRVRLLDDDTASHRRKHDRVVVPT